MLPQRGKPIPPASGTNNGRIDAPGDRPPPECPIHKYI